MRHLDGYTGHEVSSIAEFLIRIGGRSHFGFPNYRLVQSESVLEQKGGEWRDWDENLEVHERAKFVRKQFTVREKTVVLGKEVEVDVQKSILVPGNSPLRVVTEVRTVQKYSHFEMQGWILEKWYAPEVFGSPEDWYRHIVPGTEVPRLGPFPDRGQYEMIAGIFPEPPSLSFLEQMIAFQAKRAREMQERDVRSILSDKIYAHEREEEKRAQEAEAKIRDLISPLLGTSLESGRWRNEIAERAGIRSHMGN